MRFVGRPESLLRSRPESLLRSRHESLLRSRHESLLRSRHESLLRSRHESLLRSRYESLMGTTAPARRARMKPRLDPYRVMGRATRQLNDKYRIEIFPEHTM